MIERRFKWVMDSVHTETLLKQLNILNVYDGIGTCWLNFKELLTYLCKSYNIKFTEIAQKYGSSKQYISKLIDGNHYISYDFVFFLTDNFIELRVHQGELLKLAARNNIILKTKEVN